MPLSDLRIKALKPTDKPYKKSDGEGLHLLVTVTGSKLWRLSYRHLDKQKTLALGNYPVISLLEARRLKDDAKRLLAKGLDPAPVKSKVASVQVGEARPETLNDVFDEWFKLNEEQWSPTYKERFLGRWREHVRESLGKRPIREVTALVIHAHIRDIEARGLGETVHRTVQNIGRTLRYATALGRAERDFTADLRGTLKPLPAVVHQPSFKESELPEFFKRLAGYDCDPMTVLGIKIVAHTMVRTTEFREATWSEFEDLDGARPLWRIPAHRMKLRREHLVPLTPTVAGWIRALPRKSTWAFPIGGKPMSNNTMLFSLYRMGYHKKATIHGLRSTASTILNEKGWNKDWVEKQLAHEDGSVRGIYNAAEYLKGRSEMLNWWTDHLNAIELAAVGGDELDELLS